MDRVVGIDLGTTNSCIAVVERGKPIVIPNKTGSKTTPSIVAITEDGKRLIGDIAKRQLITNSKNTIYASKRLIGRKFNSKEVKRAMSILPYRVIEGPHDDIRIECNDIDF